LQCDQAYVPSLSFNESHTQNENSIPDKPREVIKGLEREMEDALSCDSCYPLCSASIYIADSTSAQLNFFYENKGSVL
jgi:hypothetical protein